LNKSCNFLVVFCIRLAVIMLLVICCGCGMIRRTAINQVGNALSGEATMEVISSDNDPELIWDAMPLALKAMEVMLAQDPSNVDLLLGVANGYIQYAYGNLAQQAQILENSDYKKSQHLWKRTHNLSLRGRDYALTALDLRHPGFSKEVRSNTKAALARTTLEDIPYLYWAAAGWAGAIAADKNDMDSMAELPIAEAMMRRVLVLDENYKNGAAHEFFIAYEGGLPEASGGSLAEAEEHFKRAIECSDGKKAFPYIVYAESVAVKQQDLPLFNQLLDQALAVDVNEVKKWRLVNTIAHERALWLREQIPELFVTYEEGDNEER
jgi:hypothetical protein